MSSDLFTPIRVMNVMTDPRIAADPSVVAAAHGLIISRRARSGGGRRRP